MSVTSTAMDRLQALVVARLGASVQPLSERELAKALARFAPPDLAPGAWAARVAEALAALRASGVVDPDGRLAQDGELEKRIGKHAARSWAQLVDRVFPGLGLGVAAADAKVHERLDGRDAWTAAIVARSLGLWTEGAPPSLGAVCDALAWRQLGLAGRAKRLPEEVRAHFLQRELQAMPGTVDRLTRLLAAREVAAPRPELRALRDALVRRWLTGSVLGPRALGSELVEAVHAIAREARDGVFGDRKVFIAAVWRGLRQRPAWAALTLPDFKQRLVAAHQAGQVSLARADLVGAMNPALVAESETASQTARFHFVVREAS